MFKSGGRHAVAAPRYRTDAGTSGCVSAEYIRAASAAWSTTCAFDDRTIKNASAKATDATTSPAEPRPKRYCAHHRDCRHGDDSSVDLRRSLLDTERRTLSTKDVGTAGVGVPFDDATRSAAGQEVQEERPRDAVERRDRPDQDGDDVVRDHELALAAARPAKDRRRAAASSPGRRRRAWP